MECKALAERSGAFSLPNYPKDKTAPIPKKRIASEKTPVRKGMGFAKAPAKSAAKPK